MINEIGETDGINKRSASKILQNQDDAESEVGQSNQDAAMSEQGDFAVNFDEIHEEDLTQ